METRNISKVQILYNLMNSLIMYGSAFQVRALAFHPTEAALVTASEDHTLKLWNLQRTVPAKKSAGLDVEPLYTFRAHAAPVLCLAMGAPRSEECFSGGLDGTIRVWNLPPPTADPYDPYDPAVQVSFS